MSIAKKAMPEAIIAFAFAILLLAALVSCSGSGTVSASQSEEISGSAENGGLTGITGSVTSADTADATRPDIEIPVTVEAGSKPSEISALIGSDAVSGIFGSDFGKINTSVLGKSSIEKTVAGQRYILQITVRDTVAPTAKVSPQLIYNAVDLPDPSSFVSNISDATKVTVSYDETPADTGKYPLEVKIRLSDEGGNKNVYTTELTIITDHNAPVITPLCDTIEIYLGETPRISADKVSVSDDNSGLASTEFDFGKAELAIPGKYTIEYVAKDRAGNEARSAVSLNIKVTDAQLKTAVKSLTDKILKSNMTVMQKMVAVYNYLSANKATQVHYADDSPHDDWQREAYLCLTTRPRGDCFAFAAVAQAVFDYLGYDTVMVQRSTECNEHGTHFWIMINLGTKAAPKWYHFDATPTRWDLKIPSYGLTTNQLRAYTLWRNDYLKDDTENYYVYNTSLYPESSDEIIVSLNSDINAFFNMKGKQDYFY